MKVNTLKKENVYKKYLQNSNYGFPQYEPNSNQFISFRVQSP